MKKICYLIILNVVSFISHAQNNFEKIVTQPISFNYVTLSKVNSKGEVLVFGSKVFSYFLYSYLLDTNGNIKWSHKYFIPNQPAAILSYQKYVEDFAFTDDDGFIAASSIADTAWKRHLVLYRFDSNGNLIWLKRFNFKRVDAGNSIVPMANKKFAICAFTQLCHSQGTNGAINFLLLDSMGNVLKSKKIGSDSISFIPISMKRLGNNFLIMGSCELLTTNTFHSFFMILDSIGYVIKTKILKSFTPDKGQNMFITHDRKILFLYGSTSTNYCNFMKLDENLNVDWNKTISSSGVRMDFRSVAESPDSSYIVSGMKWPSSSTVLSTIFKSDTSGNIIMGRTMNYPGDNDGVQVFAFGSKLFFHSASVTPSQSSDILIVTDATLTASCYLPLTSYIATPVPVTDSVVTVNHFSNYFPLNQDSILFSDTTLNYTIGDLCPTSSIKQIVDDEQFKVFPNPSNNYIKIVTGVYGELIIQDALGDVVLKKILQRESSNEHRVDLPLLSQGVYFVKMGTYVKKFIKE